MTEEQHKDGDGAQGDKELPERPMAEQKPNAEKPDGESSNQPDSTKQAILRGVTIAEWLTLLTLIAVAYQGCVMRDQLKEMRDAGAQTDKLIAQATRASTNGRAFLFVTYQPLDEPRWREAASKDRHSYQSVHIDYSITNYGPTPAIVTGIETHFYSVPWGVKEPDPRSPDAQRYHEVFKESGGELADVGASAQPIIPGLGTIAHIFKTYNFGQTEHNAMEDRDMGGGPNLLWVQIRYKDIFGIERFTSFYGKLWGAAALSVEHSEYNCGDENCKWKDEPWEATYPLDS